MTKRTFVVPFLFLILLSGQALILPSEASARCCGLCNCWMQQVYGSAYCYCGGNCPSGCNRPEDISSQKLNVMNADIHEPVIKLMTGGNCFRDKIAMSLLRNAREGLKFTPIRFDETTMSKTTN